MCFCSKVNKIESLFFICTHKIVFDIKLRSLTFRRRHLGAERLVVADYAPRLLCTWTFICQR